MNSRNFLKKMPKNDFVQPMFNKSASRLPLAAAEGGADMSDLSDLSDKMLLVRRETLTDSTSVSACRTGNPVRNRPFFCWYYN